MAVNKVVGGRCNTHGAMKNCINYVMQESKILGRYIAVTGPFMCPEITVENVYHTFLDEKKLFDKDSKRMYMHSVISFHKDEKITEEEALEFGIQMAQEDPFYKDYQNLVAVHQDRSYLHVHFVTNSVSYIDGHKEHHSSNEVKKLMERTNKKCAAQGLHVTEKGRHFDGTPIDEYDISANKRNKYQLLVKNSENSYLVQCLKVVEKNMEIATSKEEFCKLMKQDGWTVHWKDSRKNITFENEDGKKVRDSNLSKTFNVHINKEILYGKFEGNRRNEWEQEKAELLKYYDDLEAELARTDSGEARTSDRKTEGENQELGEGYCGWEEGATEADRDFSKSSNNFGESLEGGSGAKFETTRAIRGCREERRTCQGILGEENFENGEGRQLQMSENTRTRKRSR